jgi:hypothetical protein
MTEDIKKPTKQRRPRRTQAEILMEEWIAKEREEAERIARGEPFPPRPEPFRFPTNIQFDEWGFYVWPKDQR